MEKQYRSATMDMSCAELDRTICFYSVKMREMGGIGGENRKHHHHLIFGVFSLPKNSAGKSYCSQVESGGISWNHACLG